MTRAAVRIGDPADARAAAALLHRAGAVVVDDPALADVLVVDEWTPEHAPDVVAASAAGTRVTTLAEAVVRMAQGPVVGITGTAGKSSTALALAELLGRVGRPVRIGTGAPSANAWPDATVADRPGAPDEVLVAELTSTHLCHMTLPPGPDVAVITLLRPDHPDLHPSFGHYLAAKRSLVAGQRPQDVVVLPADDPSTLRAVGPTPARRMWFGAGRGDAPGAWVGPDGGVLLVDASGGVAWAEMPRLREHGARAVLAAAAAALAMGVAPEALAPQLAHVAPMPHRQRPVGYFRHALVIDDTMAATPRKALAAVNAWAAEGPVLVMGGDPDAHDPAEVHHALAHIGGLGLRVVAFGDQAQRVAGAVPTLGTAPTVMGALAMAATIAGAGGTVLVTPMFPMSPLERDRVAALPQP